MKNILVAVSLEKNTDRLLEKAEEIAKEFDSRIWILYVTEPETGGYVGLEAGPQFARDRSLATTEKEKELLERLTERLRKKGLSSEGLLIEGPTSEIIRQKVRDIPADLVVIGHHKGNFFYQLFVGNIERDIVENLKIPVLLVPVD